MTDKKDNYLVGVDLGGSNLRAVLSDREGNFLAKTKEKTRKDDKAQRIIDQIIKGTETVCNQENTNVSDLIGVGIASTGPMDLEEGTLTKPTNLPFDYVPLVNPLQEKLNVPVTLVNDSIGGAMGEFRFGAGKSYDNIVYVCISTGIGGGAIVDGRPLLGKDGNAAEIGHMMIDPDGLLECGCGKRGHWEAYCSGRNIPNFVRLKLEEIEDKRVEGSLLHKSINGDFSNLSSEILFEAAESGDGLSIELTEEIGKLNAMGFANLTNIYDPSLITVGGGVALSNEELILDPIRKHLDRYVRNRPPRIKITPLGEDASLYGAISNLLEESSR